MQSTEFTTILYHYTTLEGLLGIIGSKTLWATDAEFLNDAQEMQFGRPEVHRALLDRAESLWPEGSDPESDASPDLQDDCSRAAAIRSAAAELYPEPGPFARYGRHAAYVACFCEEGDLLSQWRGYSSGGGYALGFDLGGLCEVQGPDADLMPRLVRVHYGVGRIMAVVGPVIGAIVHNGEADPGAQGGTEGRSLVFPTLAGMKHPAFEEEREWRLIVAGGLSDKVVRFRQGAIAPTPYMALTFAPTALRRVVVGPGPHAELRRDGVARLLGASGEWEAQVLLPNAPFRG